MRLGWRGGGEAVGETQNRPFPLSFNSSLKVDFQGSLVTSDGGLILVRESDERLVRMRPEKGRFPDVACSPEAKPPPSGAAARTGDPNRLNPCSKRSSGLYGTWKAGSQNGNPGLKGVLIKGVSIEQTGRLYPCNTDRGLSHGLFGFGERHRILPANAAGLGSMHAGELSNHQPDRRGLLRLEIAVHQDDGAD